MHLDVYVVSRFMSTHTTNDRMLLDIVIPHAALPLNIFESCLKSDLFSGVSVSMTY